MQERLQPSQPYPASSATPTVGNFAAFHRVSAGSSRDGPIMAPNLSARIADSTDFQRILTAHNVKSLPIDLQHPGAAAALMDQANALAARLAGGEWGAPPAAGAASISQQGATAPHVGRATRINDNAAPAAQQSHSPSQIIRGAQQFGTARTQTIPDLPDVCSHLNAPECA